MPRVPFVECVRPMLLLRLPRRFVWSIKMNLDDLEKQWEGGDHEEELRTEKQLEFERIERHRKEATASTGALDPRLAHTRQASSQQAWTSS